MQRPRDVPGRTALGVLVATFYACLQIAAATDIISFTFDLSTSAVFWASRIGMFVLPAIDYSVAYRICLGLQLADGRSARPLHRDRDHPASLHGGFSQVHQPLGAEGHPVRLGYRGAPVPKLMNQLLR